MSIRFDFLSFVDDDFTNHYHDSDRSRGQTPRVLVDKRLLVALRSAFQLNVEHLGEVLAQMVAGRALYRAAARRDKSLDGGGVIATSELLLLGLATLDNRHRQQLLVDSAVQVQDDQDLFVRLLLRGERGVTLLPQELSCA